MEYSVERLRENFEATSWVMEDEGYYQGQLFNMDQGQTGLASVLGIDSLEGEIALSGLSLSGYPEVIRSGTSWIPLGNQISFLLWGIVEHTSGTYCYGNIHFSTSNCPTPTHIAQLSTPCGPLAFPADSVEAIEEEALAEVLAYPNPTDGLVTIEVPADWDIVRVSVWDMTGRNILPAREIESGDSIDLSSQTVGAYLLRIVAADGRSTTKRIIRQ